MARGRGERGRRGLGGLALVALFVLHAEAQQQGVGELNTTVIQEGADFNPLASNALECEIELTYSASAINMPKFDATFAIRNNRPSELSAWQVVWRYENEKLIPGSVEGAILLATGTSSGQPARVVNTRNNAPIQAFSTKGFAFQAYSTLEDTAGRNTSRAPSSVSVNGLSCAALYSSEGIEGIREEFSDSVTSIEQCIPPGETNSSEVLFLPSCEQTYCCGLLTSSGTTNSQQVEDLQKQRARKSLLPTKIIEEENDIAWVDCSYKSKVVLVQNATSGGEGKSGSTSGEDVLTAAMIEPGGYFGVCTNTSVGPLFGEDYFDFYMLSNKEQAVSLNVALGVSTQGPKTALQQLIETEKPMYAVTDLNQADPWTYVNLDLNDLGVPGWAFFGIKNTEENTPIPVFIYDMGLYAAVDEPVGKAQKPKGLNWEYLKNNANLTVLAGQIEASGKTAGGSNAYLPAILFTISAVLVIIVIGLASTIIVRKRQQKIGKLDMSASSMSGSGFFNKLDLRGLKDAIIQRYERKTSISSNVQLDGAPEDGIFDIDFDAEIKLQEILGSGGFGTVHKGVWKGDSVAVKIMHGMNEGSSLLEAFKKEVFLLSRLKHPGIVNFLGASLTPPNVCIVQELAEGGSLYTLLHGDGSENKPMKYVELLQYGLDIADAMAYLHPTVVHRDLKSQNVLLDVNKRAKVCDFGIAKLKEKTLLTTVNSQAGTPAYMAPELFAAGNVSEKVDVFSYGVLLWECFTGCVPWDELCTPMQVIFAVGVQKQRLPIPPHCPTFLANLMQDCWREEPENRPSFNQILGWMETEYDKYVAAKSLLVAEGLSPRSDASSP